MSVAAVNHQGGARGQAGKSEVDQGVDHELHHGEAERSVYSKASGRPEDDAEARRDAAAYARRVRRRTGLSQAAFAARIGVPLDTVRNWEQGKPAPAGPARALLRVLDRMPEAALAALG